MAHFTNYTANYTAFKDKMLREGYDEIEIGSLPGAREAHEADRAQAHRYDVARTKAEWLKADAQGNPGVEFQTQEEMTTAINDPMYKISPGYRDAVLDCIGRMDQSRVVPEGVNPLDEMTGAKMIQTAEDELARSQYRHLVKESATNSETRLVLLQMLASEDPNTQAWIAKGTGAISGANERPLDKASREGGGGRYGSDLSKAMAEPQNNGPMTDAEASAAGPKGVA